MKCNGWHAINKENPPREPRRCFCLPKNNRHVTTIRVFTAFLQFSSQFILAKGALMPVFAFFLQFDFLTIDKPFYL